MSVRRFGKKSGYNKYGAKKTVVDGFTFDSKKEAGRYRDLSLLEKAGKIKYLSRQVKFELIPKQSGEQAVTYIADFVYHDVAADEIVVEDVKGYGKDKAYIIKRKLFKLRYPKYK